MEAENEDVRRIIVRHTRELHKLASDAETALDAMTAGFLAVLEVEEKLRVPELADFASEKLRAQSRVLVDRSLHLEQVGFYAASTERGMFAVLVRRVTMQARNIATRLDDWARDLDRVREEKPL